MIKVWEAHRDLSEAIGDSVSLNKYTESNPPNNIPDGVVFSKSMRNTFLYRAMLSVLRSKLMTLAVYPVRDAAIMYYRLFPNTVKTETLQGSTLGTASMNDILVNPTTRDILVLISVRVDDGTGRVFPVPIKSGKDIGTLYNTGNAHSSDLMCTFIKDMGIVVYDEPQYFTGGSEWYTITYLPYPRDPALAVTKTGGAYNWTDTLDIEDSHYPEMLAYARLLAMADSLDYDSGRMLEQELNMIVGQNTVIQRRQQ